MVDMIPYRWLRRAVTVVAVPFFIVEQLLVGAFCGAKEALETVPSTIKHSWNRA